MCIVSFKTITAAQRARNILTSGGVASSVVGVDPNLTKRGCSWGLSIDRSHKVLAIRLLRQNGAPFGDVFCR